MIEGSVESNDMVIPFIFDNPNDLPDDDFLVRFSHFGQKYVPLNDMKERMKKRYATTKAYMCQDCEIVIIQIPVDDDY